MEYMARLKRLRELITIRSLMTWLSRDRLIRETKVQMIDHILTALCTCEMNEKGREYLIKLKNDISSPQNKTKDHRDNWNR